MVAEFTVAEFSGCPVFRCPVYRCPIFRCPLYHCPVYRLPLRWMKDVISLSETLQWDWHCLNRRLLEFLLQYLGDDIRCDPHYYTVVMRLALFEPATSGVSAAISLGRHKMWPTVLHCGNETGVVWTGDFWSFCCNISGTTWDVTHSTTLW